MKIANKLASILLLILILGTLVKPEPATAIDPTSTPTVIKRGTQTFTPTNTQTQTPTRTPTIVPSVTHSFNYDSNSYNGYWWYGMWTPGLPAFESQFMRMPGVSIGSAVFYAPDVMQAQIEYRGLSMDGMIGAVALPFCSEIGHSVWIMRPGLDWEGPYMVADCSRRNDLYGHIIWRDQVVEVDFDTAVRWGMARYGGQQNEGRWSALTGRLNHVLISMSSPEYYDGVIIDLTEYFLKHVTYAPLTEYRDQLQNYRTPEPGGYPEWLINGTWVSFP